MKNDSYEHNKTDSHISFSMPELTGTELYICEDIYPLYAENERLTDTFLDTLIEQYQRNTFDFSYTLYGDLEYKTPTNIHFQPNSILIKQNGIQKSYPVTTKDFCEAFFANVQKYALYWAAPANYRAWFFASFDDFVKKAERYRKAGEEIADKLPIRLFS